MSNEYDADEQIPSWATVEGDDRETYSNSHSFYDQVKFGISLKTPTLSLF
jgi:hypothetical protein